MQPDVHRRGIVRVTGEAQLVREFLAGGQTGIHVEQLHQVDDRVTPVQRLAGTAFHAVEHLLDIDRLSGGGG